MQHGGMQRGDTALQYGIAGQSLKPKPPVALRPVLAAVCPWKQIIGAEYFQEVLCETCLAHVQAPILARAAAHP